jgi:hypothetical protein
MDNFSKINSHGFANTQADGANGRRPRSECLAHLGCKSRLKEICAVGSDAYGLKVDASQLDGAQ